MIFDVKSRKDELLEQCYGGALKELNEFFEMDWKRNKPAVFLMADRETMDKHRGIKTERWVTGYVNGANIFILAPENYEKESLHKFSEENYYKLIKHEMVHSFELIISKNKNKPDWLWEGLALYLAGQVQETKKPKHLKEFLKYYAKSGKGVYNEAGFAVKFLVEKYGKEKLLKLLKSLKDITSEKQFCEKFRDIYGFVLDYKNFW